MSSAGIETSAYPPTNLEPIQHHAAVELGIARTAIAETIAFVRQRTRPWIDAKIDYGYEDPLTISQVAFDMNCVGHQSPGLREPVFLKNTRVLLTASSKSKPPWHGQNHYAQLSES